MRISIFLAFALAIGMARTPVAHAGTFNVSCDAVVLKVAIATVNTNGEEDLVWLAPSCVYALTESLIVDYDAGNPVRIYGRGATLSGGQLRTPLIVNGGATLHLHDAVVRDGVTSDQGGGIRNLGTLTLSGATVSGNTAGSYGAGIYNSGRLRLAGSTVSGNQAVAGGGGIDNDGTGSLTLSDSTVSGNSGAYGGGVRNEHRAALFNSTFFGNGGPLGGDLLNETSGVAALHNVTVSVGDVGGSGPGGIFNDGALTLQNSILADASAGGDACWSFGTLTPLGGNLVEDGSCSIPGALSGDPRLGSPAGEPAFLPLLAGSPALDAGAAGGCPGVDQRLVLRPQDGNQDGAAVCDLGAFEKQAKGACGLLGIEGFLLLPLARRLARARGPQPSCVGSEPM